MTTHAHQATDHVSWSSLPELDLIARARMKEEAAIRELIRRLNPRLFRIARGIVSSDAEAEEVVQETYLAASTGGRVFQHGSPALPSTRH